MGPRSSPAYPRDLCSSGLWLIAHLALVAARGEYETSGRSLLQAHFKAKALQEHAKEHAKELPELETLADLVVKKVVTRLEPPKLRAKPLNLDQLSPTCRARPAPPARLAQDNASSSRSERGSCAQELKAMTCTYLITIYEIQYILYHV